MTNKYANLLPPVESHGFPPGASSPHEAALIRAQNAGNAQTELINNHKGGSKDVIVVPQAPDYTGGNAGPVTGNTNAVKGARTLTQGAADAEFDNLVGKPPQSGGKCGCRKGGSRRRKSKRSRYNKKSKRTRRRRKTKRKLMRRSKQKRKSRK